jgi:glucose-1-phosphate adenylyltransferase
MQDPINPEAWSDPMSILVNRTLGILLAGGVGERLYPLTRHRAKPAVPFGGHYRIVDVTLSNCINSGLRKVFILTQYKSLSLNRHIRNGWYNVVANDLEEFIEIIPPQQRVGETWYLGTADAVWQNLYTIGGVENIEFVLILGGDHIYKMNYYRMVKQHVDTRADVTIGAIEVPIEEGSRYGILSIDSSSRVRSFVEKPANPSPYWNKPAKALASMGIYVFNKKLLEQILEEDSRNPASSHDFGTDLLGSLVEKYNVCAHNFVDENKKEAQYWRDVGTIESYYEANIDLVAVTPLFNLYDKDWPIRTHQRQYPPAKFVFADEGKRMGIAVDSIVSAGCIISGGRVQSSILSPDVRVNSYCEISNSIIFAHCDIGRRSRIRNAIVDRDVHLPEETVIGYDPEEDRRRYYMSETGIVVVAPEDTCAGAP